MAMKRPRSKIKKNDEVIVISGKDKNKKGKVLAVRFEKNGNAKVLVSGINLSKKHIKANPQINETGGVREKEGFFPVSKVMFYNANTNKGERIGIKVLKDGKRTRCFAKTGEVIEDSKEG